MRRWKEQRERKGGLEKTEHSGIVKSNRGEGPEDKRMDRMWQRRDTQLQDCERCQQSSLRLIFLVEETACVHAYMRACGSVGASVDVCLSNTVYFLSH